MKKTVTDIARLIDGKVVGDKKQVIKGFNSLEFAEEGDLTLLTNSKYFSKAAESRASAVVVGLDVTIDGKTVIQTAHPSLSFSRIAALFSSIKNYAPKGIHPTAVIAKSAKLGRNISAGPYVVIEEKSVIGDNVILYAGCYVGGEVKIANNCTFYPQVIIYDRTEIGKNVIVHSGSVLGSDGYGYEQINGKHEKIPQLGIVVIEDDVEIGANVTIDRARFDKTFIGRGTKIDNLVQIAHNVAIGEDCLIISQVGISGSTKIGKNSILAGQAGLAGHLTIGENSIIAAQAGVIKSLPPGSKVSGYPAKPHEEAKIVNAHLQRLPHYVETIQAMQKRIEALEAEIQKNRKNK